MSSLSPHLFWITSRAAGISAMVFASISVGLGLSMAAKLGKSRLSDRRTLHEALSIGVMISIVVHAVSLLFDAYLHPSVADITIPLVSSYHTIWMTIGIVSGWGMIAFGLAYYARRRIGPKRWKVVHRFTLLTWLGGLVHTLGMGTDAGAPWFLALVALSVAPSLVLLGLRVAPALQDRTVPRPAAPRARPRPRPRPTTVP